MAGGKLRRGRNIRHGCWGGDDEVRWTWREGCRDGFVGLINEEIRWNIREGGREVGVAGCRKIGER